MYTSPDVGAMAMQALLHCSSNQEVSFSFPNEILLIFKSESADVFSLFSNFCFNLKNDSL